MPLSSVYVRILTEIEKEPQTTKGLLAVLEGTGALSKDTSFNVYLLLRFLRDRGLVDFEAIRYHAPLWSLTQDGAYALRAARSEVRSAGMEPEPGDDPIFPAEATGI